MFIRYCYQSCITVRTKPHRVSRVTLGMENRAMYFSVRARIISSDREIRMVPRAHLRVRTGPFAGVGPRQLRRMTTGGAPAVGFTRGAQNRVKISDDGRKGLSRACVPDRRRSAAGGAALPSLSLARARIASSVTVRRGGDDFGDDGRDERERESTRTAASPHTTTAIKG